MKKRYMINGQIYFFPSTSMLMSPKTNKQHVIPCGIVLCFEKLLEKPGGVVSWDQLLDLSLANIENRHMCMAKFSLLKRKIRSLGLIEDLFFTVRNRGLLINPSLTLDVEYCRDICPDILTPVINHSSKNMHYN